MTRESLRNHVHKVYIQRTETVRTTVHQTATPRVLMTRGAKPKNRLDLAYLAIMFLITPAATPFSSLSSRDISFGPRIVLRWCGRREKASAMIFP